MVGAGSRAAAQTYEFTTFAGDARYASSDGPGREARFSFPADVTVDGSGVIYVADTGNNMVRVITPAGVVSSLAGRAGTLYSEDGLGSRAYADGVGDAARFNYPVSVAVDRSGNLYVADVGNGVIRKITASGVVTTFAGASGAGLSVDGVGDAARFAGPSGVAVDGGGNVYVADRNTVRKITPDRVVSTLAGAPGAFGAVDGVGAAARFNGVSAVTTDIAGTLYVADVFQDLNGGHPIIVGSTIRRIARDGRVTTLAGAASGSGAIGRADGAASVARFNNPQGIAVDEAGNIYVSDTGNHTIRKLAPDGLVSTLAGLAGVSGTADGAGAAARFAAPDGLCVDAGGTVIVADAGNQLIRRITAAGVVTTVAGNSDRASVGTGPNLYVNGQGGAARFSTLDGLVVDQTGSLLVADVGNQAIRKVSPSGLVTSLSDAVTGRPLVLAYLSRFALDPQENLWVMNAEFLQKIAVSGVVTNQSLSHSGDRFVGASGIAVDGGGNVFLSDETGNVIRKVTPGGVVTTFAGTLAGPGASGALGGSADGNGLAAQFWRPAGLALDRSGNLFVADSANYTIRRITPAGGVTTVAGLARVKGGEDGAGAAARFLGPRGVAVDDAGNLFVADDTIIRKISPAGVVATIAGKANSRGSADGTGSTARFAAATAIGVDRAGNVFVADAGNKTIRKGVPLASPARLTNVSVLATLRDNEEALTIGTIIGGAGTSGTKPLLVRAVGPSLAAFGVAGPLADPALEFFSGRASLSDNDDWGGAPALRALFAEVGAFPLATSTSKDAALHVPAAAAGQHTVRVAGRGVAGGVVLIELYDAASAGVPSATTPRLTNVSVLKSVGAGLTAGFIVRGDGPKTMIVRVVGPSLVPFGLGEVLADPRLELFDSASRRIATSDDWAENGVLVAIELRAAFLRVGAFPLASETSKDAALLISLRAGAYTVRASSSDSASGPALIEIYEVP